MTTISPSKSYSTTCLSSEEIYEISKEINKKYSPVITMNKSVGARKIALTPKQMLDISEELTRKYTLKINAEKPKLVLLPIDPNHLYVSWNIGNTITSSEIGDKKQNQNIVLRIYPKTEENNDHNSTMNWFDFPIEQDQTRRTIPLSKENKTNSYAAAIGKLDRNNTFIVLAKSQVIHKPDDINTMNSPGQKIKLTSSQFQTSSIQQNPLFESINASSSNNR